MTLVYSVPVTIGERLIKARNRKKLSQEDVARLVGRTQSTVSLWEADKKLPKVRELRRVAEAYGINPMHLVPGLKEAA